MPRSTSGKWVARAAATGGGRTYRGQVPVNWYVALILIVVIGIGSVVYARSEYRSAAAANTVPPTKGTTWYVGFVFDICGTLRQPVTANETDPTKQSFYTSGDGIIVVSPKKTTVAGTHAVLGKFVSGYQGMGLTATSVTVPPSAAKAVSTTTTTAPTTTTTTTTTAGATTTTTAPASSTTTTAAAASATTGGSGIQLVSKTAKKGSSTTGGSSTTTSGGGSTTTTKAPTSTTAPTTTTTTQPSKTYTNGMTCPKGTKDAGKTGSVTVVYWPSAFATKAKSTTVTGDPATLRFSANQEITIGFVPAGTTLPKPTGTVVEALLKASEGASISTSTTTTTATSTTAPATSTSTTAGTTTTTTAASATTTTSK